MPSSGSAGDGRKSRVGLPGPGPGRVGWKTRVVRVRREREREEGRNGSENNERNLNTFLIYTKISRQPRTSADHNFHIRSPFYACHMSTNSYRRALQLP